jgi:hypothetical protein
LLRFARNDGAERVSPLLWRNVPDPRHMHGDVIKRVFQMYPLVRRRLRGNANARPPLLCGADWPRRKAAAAVRADIVDLARNAIGAEGAFVRADACLRRIRRKVPVAIFAVRPKLQRHGHLSVCGKTIVANPSCDSKGEYPSICATLRLQRQPCAFLQPVQYDRRAHMRHARMWHQHVVDDVRQALEIP